MNASGYLARLRAYSSRNFMVARVLLGVILGRSFLDFLSYQIDGASG